MPKMWRQNKNTDTTAHGVRGISSILPEVQIYLRDPFQERKNRRNQNARRLDAVQTTESVCTAFIVFLLNWSTLTVDYEELSIAQWFERDKIIGQDTNSSLINEMMMVFAAGKGPK